MYIISKKWYETEVNTSGYTILHFVVSKSFRIYFSQFECSFIQILNIVTEVVYTIQYNSTLPIFLSSLPGRNKAGSNVSGLFVAMIIFTWPRASKPSIWFNNWNIKKNTHHFCFNVWVCKMCKKILSVDKSIEGQNIEYFFEFNYSEWLFINGKWAIFQLYHDKNKLHFKKMMMRFTFY